jgi:hypothetical protein
MSLNLRAFVNDHITEIRDSPTLRLFGSALALTHFFTYFFWRSLLPEALTDPFTAYCWPFFTSCYRLHGGDTAWWSAMFLAYALFSIIVGALFQSRRSAFWAWLGLAILSLWKVGLFVLDYRFMGNYHIMPLFATLPFLFLPKKIETVRYLICLFYFFAGYLKTNPEWLSGAALGGPGWFTDTGLFPVALAYVIVLEMVFVWGLLVPWRGLRWAALAQFVAFHSLSWTWVGWFYPAIMACLLAIFPMSWREKPASDPLRLPPSVIAFLFLFALIQVVPQAIYGPLFTLDGRIRLLSLNMFDARANCMGSILVRFEDETLDLFPNYGAYGVRIRCDPILFLAEAASICRANQKHATFRGVDVYLVARQTTGQDAYRILDRPNFCGPNSPKVTP